MPLVALLGLMHFRIASLVFVFGRAGSPHNGGIHNRSAMHDQSGMIQALPDIRKQLFSNVVLLKEMTELEQCGSVGNPLVREIYAQKILHRIAIVHSIFHTLVRQAEPVLHQIHTEHGFCANRPASVRPFRIIRLYHVDPVLPGNHLVHQCEELFAPSPTAAIVIFVICKTGLLIHGASSSQD